MLKKNILYGMTANEKRFMRLIDEKLKGNYSVAEKPERKRSALEIYRRKVAEHCSECFEQVANDEANRVAQSLIPRVKKPKVESVEEEE